MTNRYVHGYDTRENIRLQDQASTLVDLLHHDTYYPPGSQVLEAGCGVGAQTITLAKNSPQAHITSVDISESSVAEARKKVDEKGLTNVTFHQGDIFNLAYKPESFDHIFVCFVLEHLSKPIGALNALKKLLKKEITAPHFFIRIVKQPTERSNAKLSCKKEPEVMPISVGSCIPY